MPRCELLLESCEDRILCSASLYPVTAPVYLQTSGASAGAGVGDWYTASGTSSTDRAHYIAVEVTSAMLTAGGGTVAITVNDADTAAGGNDEVRNARDPARFTLLGADRSTVAAAAVTVPNTAADGTNVTFNVTAAGIYYVKAETGALPISGDATAANNDDDNSYTISVSQSGGALGSYQSSYQQSAAGTRNFYFFVGPGTSSLYLRNFDLDGGASAISYIRPDGTTVAGTISGNALWNGAAGTLNTGGDTISGLTSADWGVWTYRISNWTTGNQTVFEANTGAGQRLVLSDVTATRAGNFTITPDSTLYTNIGTPANHAFSVTNNFLTSDIINFTLSGTATGYTAQLFTAGGVALTDTDGDGKIDTGVLAAGQTGNYTLRVTPSAGAGGIDTTRISGVSFMDTKVDAADNTTSFVDKTTKIYGSITGFVYQDSNNNGVKDSGEAGIAGTSICLTGTDVNGAAVNTTVTTSGTGAYFFTDLLPSNAAGYTITETTQPAGFLDGLNTVGNALGSTTNNPPSDIITGVIISDGANASGYDLGELNPVTLSGSVYGDLDGDGIFDSFESGIAGATVTLTGANDLGAITPIVATTNASGAYTFANLRPGTYKITETQPAGYNDGADTLGTGFTAPNSAGTAGADTFTSIVVSTVAAGNATGAGYNFGESPSFGLTKSIESTSVAGTAGSNVAIGETVTFRLVATIPTGSFTDFQFQDALPTGLQFVNGSAVVALVSSAGQLTSSTLAGAGLAQTAVGTPTFAMPDAAVSNSATSNVDTYVSGTDIFFKLGKLTNTDANAATTESVVIEFQAIVVNESGNQAATNLANTFSVLLDKDGVGAPSAHGAGSNNATVTAVEPVLAVTKTLAMAGSDAGDSVQYTITITNALGNAATAYDINLADMLANSLALSSISASGASITANTTSGNNVAIVLDQLAAGASATVTINATVASAATAGTTIGNNTTVTWTSTPGANADERSGAGGVNDYTATANASTFRLGTPTVDKLTPPDTTYSVGETVTYDILVTVPEGVTQGLSITDNLPAGLNFVSAALQTSAGGVLGTPFGGTVPPPSTTNVGNSYTFTFGNVTVTGDNDGANNSFVLRVTARVANVAGNQNAVVLTNTATLTYNDGTAGLTTVTDPTPNVNITVVEPVLSVDKQVVGTSTGFDAGDTVQFQIVMTNSGTADAHEVTLTDTVPAGLLITSIDSTTPTGVASVDVATSGVGTAALGGEYTIPAGGSITVLYTATLQNSVTPNTDYINIATVAFSSVNGMALGQGTATGERVGTSPNLQGDGSLNDYRVNDAAQVSTGGVLTVAKSVNKATPAIGDMLTYTVTLTLNEGTTNGIVVTDTLPANGDLRFVTGSATAAFGTVGSSLSGSVAPVLSGANNQILTFDLGSAVIPAGAEANTVVLTYQVLVSNVSTNRQADVETNNAAVVATGLTPPAPGVTTVTLTEPTLTFTKAANVTGTVSAGDSINYTLTITNPGGANSATAFDALVHDAMPADVRITSITATTLGGGATTDSAVTITGGGSGLSGQYDIPVGASVIISYVGAVQVTAPLGSVQTNNAEVTWTSVDGGNSLAPDANERYGAAGSLIGDGTLNDYRRVSSQSITIGTASFAKQLFSTDNTATAGSNVAIGEVVTYALVVTIPAGTAPGLTIIDTLPAGLQYVSSSLITTASAGGGLLAADFNGSVAAPSVGGGTSDGDDVTFSFGAITAAADGVSNNNTFLVLVAARVTDVVGNSGLTTPTVLANSATFDIPGDGVAAVTPPAVNVTVAEPQLKVTKAVDDASVNLGQTLHFTLTISHTAASTAGAFDILVRDALPAGLSGIANLTVSGATVDTNTSTSTLLDLKLASLALGAAVVVEFDATVGTAAVLSGNTIENNARIFWDSDPAESANSVANGTADGNGDRDYGAAGGDEIFDQDTQDAQDTVRFTVNESTVSGSVYHDVNASGTFDAGDASLAGQSVRLTGTTLFGEAVDLTVVTAADGSFTFINLAASDAAGYVLTETQPGGYVDALETVSTFYGGTVSGLLGSNTISAIVVPANTNSGSGYDFGEMLASSVAGSVYLDANNDGVRQGAEPGIASAQVRITGTDVFGQVVSTDVSTDANGNFFFDGGGAGLRAGTYTIVELAPPAGYLDGKEASGTSGGSTVTDDQIGSFTLPAGTAAAGYFFAEVAPSSIGGFAYFDADNDGVFAGGESGIAGVTVTLSGVDDLGNVVSITTTTGLDGVYRFDDLRPGTYTLAETQPAGLLDGLDSAGTSNGTLANDSINGIVVSPGASETGINFGDLRPSSISGVVYIDAENNGVIDVTDALQAGVEVALLGTDDLGKAVNLTTTTDGSGAYTFANLRPGTYTLSEVQPAGLLDGQDTLGAQGGSVANDSFTFTLVENTDGSGNNFGEVEAGTIAGAVYLDGNNNGTRDLAEKGIAGVVVHLTGIDDLGAAVDVTTVTDATGAFAFSKVRPGTYTLIETQPNGFRDGVETAGPMGGDVTTNDSIAAIVLPPGSAALDNLFAERSVPPVVPPPKAPAEYSEKPRSTPEPFFFAFDSFHNFSQPANAAGQDLPGLAPIDIWRPALLPIAPIYSGAANPGATLVVDLYNANGIHIASMTVMADAGGNWLANFGMATLRDTPSDVRITQVNAPYSFGAGTGANLRTYYAPAAINPGHFLSQTSDAGLDDQPAPLLGGLDLANPIQLGTAKYGGEFLPSEGVASGD